MKNFCSSLVLCCAVVVICAFHHFSDSPPLVSLSGSLVVGAALWLALHHTHELWLKNTRRLSLVPLSSQHLSDRASRHNLEHNSNQAFPGRKGHTRLAVHSLPHELTLIRDKIGNAHEPLNSHHRRHRCSPSGCRDNLRRRHGAE
jgi:hypothetical protein